VRQSRADLDAYRYLVLNVIGDEDEAALLRVGAARLPEEVHLYPTPFLRSPLARGRARYDFL
jgi:hypothetical protein